MSKRSSDDYAKAMKKIEKAGGTSGASDFTQRELIFHRLVYETEKYLEMKKVDFGEEDKNSGLLQRQRGIIRGMSLAYAKIWANAYEWAKSTKEVEKKAVRFAKEIKDVSEDQRSEWWARRGTQEL